MNPSSSLDQRLRSAIRAFWSIRDDQAAKQGERSGTRDTGARAAVTGGAQMNGFVTVIRDLLEESGLEKPVIYTERSVELPGWYRPEKKWDLLVVVDGCLIAAIEFKSQVGSFGNNYNNRTEEGSRKCDGHLGCLPRGCFCSIEQAVARLRHVVGRCARVDRSGAGQRAPLQGVRGISKQLVCQAI